METYKIVRISPLVSLTLRERIRNEISFDEHTYQECLESILTQQYTYGDSFSVEMNQLGNDSCEIS